MKAQKMVLAGREGVVFIVALIVVGVMAASLVLFSTLIMRDSFNARKEMNLMKALYVADAGANMALWELQKGENGDIGQVAFAAGTYEVDTTGNEIVSTGIVKGRSRTVRLNIFNPKGAFSYGVFTDGTQEYSGGGSGDIVVGDVHSNNAAPDINNPSHYIVDEDEYEKTGPGPDYGFPKLDIAYYRTLAVTAGRHYTNVSITLPQAKDAVTLVELTGGEEISITSGGTGILIVIGGDVKMTGSGLFTGLLYVNDSNMNGTGLGGNVRIGGGYKVKGAVVSRTANTIHGDTTVTYDPSSGFTIDDLVVDTDDITITVYSWQGS